MVYSFRYSQAFLLLAGTVLASQPMLARGAEAAPAADQERPSRAVSESDIADIVVTAQRREQRLQDVPIAVSAINAAALERASVGNVSDIATVVPNIQINQTVGNTFGPLITIRGLSPSADTSLARDQPVGLYLDGVPIGKSTGAAFDTVDLERVEVLRGPQGTLYGKNTIGGAVNLITRKPSGEFGGSLTLGAGEWGRFTERLVVDLPEVGGFSVKLSASGRQNRGYYRNETLGGHLGEEDMAAGRVDVLWRPSGNFSALYSYDITDSRGTPANLTLSAPGLVPSVNAMVAPYISTTRPHGIGAQSALRSDFQVNGHALTLEWQAGETGAGDITLRSITSRRRTFTWSASDFDGTPLDIMRIQLNNDYRQFTQEFQVIGDGDQLDFTLGAFYLSDKYSVYNPRWTLQFGRDNYDLSMRGGKSKSYAGYGQLSWTPHFLNDALTLTVGGRYTREEKNAWELFLANSAYTANPAAVGSGVFARDEDGNPILRSGGPALGALPGGAVGPDDLIPLRNSGVWKEFTPEFSFVYRVDPSWSFYGRVATGFKSGGINDTAATNAAFMTPYDPERLLSFELGTKFNLGRLLRLDIAGYHSIYKDFQAGVFVPELVTTNIINADEARFTGVEVEGSLRPTDNLTFNFGFGYIDARYHKFVLPSGQDVTDSYSIPLVPKWNYQIGGVYSQPVGIGTLEFSANYNWRSRQWSSINADPLPVRRAYGLLDGRIALKDIDIGGGNMVELAVWGRNLTDTKYWVSGINLSLFTVRQWADPRSFGAEARLRF